MYLFTRAGRFAPGSMRDAMSFVGSITEKVQQETGLEVHAWAATLSPELGTTVWATFVEDLQELEQAEDKLAVSDAFAELADKGATLFSGPLTDGLASIVYGSRDPSAPLPAYVTAARAVAANGALQAALEHGVEIAETATRITGAQTMFMVDASGLFGACRWTTGFPDITSLERAEQQLQQDPSWLALIDRVGPSYTQGAVQSIYRRIV